MVQAIYNALTSHVGMYFGYVIPIVYFLIIVMRSVVSRMKKQGGDAGAKGLAAVAAIAVILLDFIRFVYLYASGTGVLLPPGMLFVKYGIGFLLWLWVLWYSYEVHFSRRIAS